MNLITRLRRFPSRVAWQRSFSHRPAFQMRHFSFEKLTPTTLPTEQAPTKEQRHWSNPMPNTQWTNEEIQRARYYQPKHKPKNITDKLLYGAVRAGYHTFNAATGYNKADPTPESCALRLIFLESIAGVPGIVAASVRHFASLRNLERDFGWVPTLLEEAENERMHLLIVLRMFKTSKTTRGLVRFAQMVNVPALTLTTIINPKILHRFVGYLEETAVYTYADLIEKVETPGTKLNKAWADLPAPQIAKTYWRMSEDAMWIDVLKQMMADEANHRDVNHTFAALDPKTINPYIQKHHKNMESVVNHMKRKTDSMCERDVLQRSLVSVPIEELRKVYDTLPTKVKADGVTTQDITAAMLEKNIEFTEKFLALLNQASGDDAMIGQEEWTDFCEKLEKVQKAKLE